jgi:hypothetical protein
MKHLDGSLRNGDKQPSKYDRITDVKPNHFVNFSFAATQFHRHEQNGQYNIYNDDPCRQQKCYYEALSINIQPEPRKRVEEIEPLY